MIYYIILSYIDSILQKTVVGKTYCTVRSYERIIVLFRALRVLSAPQIPSHGYHLDIIPLSALSTGKRGRSSDESEVQLQVPRRLAHLSSSQSLYLPSPQIDPSSRPAPYLTTVINTYHSLPPARSNPNPRRRRHCHLRYINGVTRGGQAI